MSKKKSKVKSEKAEGKSSEPEKEVKTSKESEQKPEVKSEKAEVKASESANAADAEQAIEGAESGAAFVVSTLEDVLAAVTKKCNADKKRRGMSQPNAVDRELIKAQSSLKALLDSIDSIEEEEKD